MKWAILALLLAMPADAATLRLMMNLPTRDQFHPDSCWTQVGNDFMPRDDGPPISGLDKVLLRFERLSYPSDTLWHTIPVTTSMDSVGFEMQVLDGIQGFVRVWTEDPSGNRSCMYAQYTFDTQAVEAPPPGPGGLSASYHRWVRDANGIRQFSALLAARVDTTVDFDWGLGSPAAGVPPDSFCTRWTGTLTVPTTGAWTLYVSSEDGFRLYVDGTLRRDWWMVTFEQEVGTVINLTAGSHQITLEYFANVGHSACHLRYSGPGTQKQVIPRSALTP